MTQSLDLSHFTYVLVFWHQNKFTPVKIVLDFETLQQHNLQKSQVTVNELANLVSEITNG